VLNGLDTNREREKPTPARIRCAVYTRKSTEEGLDQDFNSLDPQREAAEAYIQSQKNLGWTLVPINPLRSCYAQRQRGFAQLDTVSSGGLMKNPNKKILQFPAPKGEPFPTTVFFQVGSTRFAIHMHIEELPPAEPRPRLVSQDKKIVPRPPR
jgi:hypothetical protein